VTPLVCASPEYILGTLVNWAVSEVFALHYQGLKVAVIEGHDIGGTCVNRGCVPSKALLAASGRVRDMKNAHHLKSIGITVSFHCGSGPNSPANQPVLLMSACIWLRHAQAECAMPGIVTRYKCAGQQCGI